jgi:EAL domain-containing protein (putative c-di-GMP-specific phosphodiesterase class I)
MIEEACKTIYRAKELDIDLNLAIDLSQQQFRNIHLVKETIKRFDNYGVPAQNLTVEIKETSVMNDVQFKRLLAQFKAANIKIALDDFGFHPFTLASLQDLKVDEIKLNKACISNIDKDNSSKNFAGAIIHLAQTLNFNVVADGVETESMRQILTDLGCNHMQGYLNTKPIAEAKLFNLLKKHDLDHQLKNQSSESTFQEVSS